MLFTLCSSLQPAWKDSRFYKQSYYMLGTHLKMPPQSLDWLGCKTDLTTLLSPFICCRQQIRPEYKIQYHVKSLCFGHVFHASPHQTCFYPHFQVTMSHQ